MFYLIFITILSSNPSSTFIQLYPS